MGKTNSVVYDTDSDEEINGPKIVKAEVKKMGNVGTDSNLAQIRAFYEQNKNTKTNNLTRICTNKQNENIEAFWTRNQVRRGLPSTDLQWEAFLSDCRLDETE